MNAIILCIHVATVCSLTLFALYFGKEILIAWLALLAVAMNLFVLKQVTLFGLSVTPSDSLAVGYLLGLNLIQEFFGKQDARRCVWISIFTSLSFVLLSQIHLFYLPNQFDLSQSHFTFLLRPMGRIMFASLFSFILVQFIDLSFFGFLKRKSHGKFLTLRSGVALILSQTLDTLIFTFFGLYGLVASVWHIILLSLIVKGVVIILSSPFIFLSKGVRHVKV